MALRWVRFGAGATIALLIVRPNNSLKTEVHMFLVTWQVGQAMPGATTLTLMCTVDTVHHIVNGSGEVFFDQPVSVRSQLRGSYRRVGIFGHKGYAVAIDGHDSQGVHNLKLHMVMAEDWQSGNGSYSYRRPDGNWIHIGEQPVTKVENAQPAGVGG